MPNRIGIILRLSIIGILFVTIKTTSAQVLSKMYTPTYSDTTMIAFLNDIEHQAHISLSYSTSHFDAYEQINIPIQAYTIGEILDILFDNYTHKLIERPGSKIIISVENALPKGKKITLNGIVQDSNTGERLYGASVYHMGNDRGSFCNEDGFYSLSNVEYGDVIRVSFIGYRDEFVSVDSSVMDITLSQHLEVSTIVITDLLTEGINPTSGGELIDINSASAKVNILGEKDLMHIARQKPGVFSGSEGVGGLNVRGGTQDQNLILLEDVPMYSANHMADISSIFLEEATRDAQLIKGGFPSRYSGRLSSILEVDLKEGNAQKISGSVTANLPAIKGFLEGPISKKSTFLVGGRVSWINAYSDPLIRNLTVFDRLNLDFYDFVAKYSYRFTNTSSLSISGYKGGDNVELDRIQSSINGNDNFENNESNKFGWTNDLLSIKYTSVLTDKLFLSSNLGALKFNYRSNAAYTFTTIRQQSVVDKVYNNVITDSNIVDLIGGVGLDYFANAKHNIKLGIGIIQHRFSPKVEKSNTNIIVGVPTVDPDSITIGNEYSAYIEDTYSVNKNINIYAGVNYSKFDVRGSSFNYIQPRFKINTFLRPNISLSLTTSRMVQFVHLLVNNGLGQPSDLWVPSTDKIAPEISDQFGITLKSELGNNHIFTIGGYVKKQQNVILYNDPQVLFTTILNDDSGTNTPVFLTDRDWERRVEVGKRSIEGIEVSLYKETGKYQYMLSYTKSNAENRFDNLNKGIAFADRLDRPHDVNLSFSYAVNHKWNFGIQWVYGSGNTFTVQTIQIPLDSLGINVLTQDNLNNYRMPAFHHLDLIAKYDNTIQGKGWKVSFGIYNVYNRYNPFYIYVFNNEVKQKLVFKQLSLFPIIPNLNVSYQF